ncbi:tetratricopeptide repeat protein [Aeromonas rivuli]|jgi:tetratricopeptide (TPR) repeat protein|uniref:tetratricopeptide repeat protein n=1 Tax=Aeromonas TaxID=642 RepID=UPI0005A788DF|nr:MULTISPECIES: tetratricopeptide repeat protein [Aeromonas]MCS3457205.1 tetratricopeptide (TPR) repeat protein [Aeromonas sp. BIGb0405]MCS3461237.1 tetratricopeptide (TPR) repeat protein [Aeromonas sp. BIGb0445]
MKLLEALRVEGRIEEARQHGLLQLIEHPLHAELHYEVASLHDMLGREAQAIHLYQQAITLGLAGSSLRGALLGLGSSYRSLGQHEAALVTLEQGLALFPQASEFTAFRAMVHYNQGRHKEACEALLGLLAQSTADPSLTPYKGAMALYAEDLDRRW